VGALVSAWVGFGVQGVPWPLHMLLALVAGALAGATWAGLAGVLKARTGAHEVITTIMLNYVALLGTGYLLSGLLKDPSPFVVVAQTPKVLESARIPALLPDLRVHWGLILALALSVASWWLLFRSTIGFAIRTVGLNPSAARYAGISIGGTVVMTMALSGVLADWPGPSRCSASTITTHPDLAPATASTASPLRCSGRATRWGSSRRPYCSGRCEPAPRGCSSSARSRLTSSPWCKGSFCCWWPPMNWCAGCTGSAVAPRPPLRDRGARLGTVGVVVLDILVALLAVSIIKSTPLVLGALSGVVCERSGIVNIAIEGMMLGRRSQDLPWRLHRQPDPRSVGGGDRRRVAGVATRPPGRVVRRGSNHQRHGHQYPGRWADRLPEPSVVRHRGAAGSRHAAASPDPIPQRSAGTRTARVPAPAAHHAAVVLVIVLQFALFRTRWGLRTRAVGEHPLAADTVGINVSRLRIGNVVLGGMLAGLAGAYFTLESVPISSR